MNIEGMEIKSEYVDGQTFYIPNPDQWEILLEINPIINGKNLISISGRNPEGIMNLIFKLYEFTSKHHSFALAFYEILAHRPWYFCVILRCGDSWQRVDIGGRTCEKCGWSGSVADPSNTSLYAGAPERINAMSRAFSIPGVRCPKCYSKLPGHIIWTEMNS